MYWCNVVPGYTSSIDLGTETLRESEEDQPGQHEDPERLYLVKKSMNEEQSLIYLPFL